MRLALGALLLLVAASPGRPSGPSPVGSTAIATGVRTLAFCGDLMLHKGVKRAAQASRRSAGPGRSANHDGFTAPLVGLRPLLRRADMAFCNLECPLVTPGTGDPYCMKTSGNYWFSAPRSAAGALAWAGFTVASVANNHIDNAGPAGVASTVEALGAAGVTVVGTGASMEDAETPVVVDVRGLKVAFLAWCSSRLGRDPNGEDAVLAVARANPGVPRDMDRVEAAVRRARNGADLVVVSFHWGPGEYGAAPNPAIVLLARRLAEAGADVVAGHHPHVLHPVETWTCRDGRRALLMYSLGNLVSNQSPDYRWDVPGRDEDAARRREGAVIVAGFSPGRNGGGARLVGWKAAPLWTQNNHPAWRGGIEAARVDVVAAEAEAARLRRRAAFLDERAARIRRVLSADVSTTPMAGESLAASPAPPPRDGPP